MSRRPSTGHKPSVRDRLAASLAMAGLVLAQIGAPSSNLGIPQVPGTRTPESNPATAMPSPQISGSSTQTAPSTAGATTAPGTASGPGYSFGAAPPPIASPGR